MAIDGEAYWDSGFRADPARSPLLALPRLQAWNGERRDASDEPVHVLLIGINPLIGDELPLLAWQIMDRASEISLNSSARLSRSP